MARGFRTLAVACVLVLAVAGVVRVSSAKLRRAHQRLAATAAEVDALWLRRGDRVAQLVATVEAAGDYESGTLQATLPSSSRIPRTTRFACAAMTISSIRPRRV